MRRAGVRVGVEGVVLRAFDVDDVRPVPDESRSERPVFDRQDHLVLCHIPIVILWTWDADFNSWESGKMNSGKMCHGRLHAAQQVLRRLPRQPTSGWLAGGPGWP